MSLRSRILLSLAPLAVLLAALGVAGFLLINRMGGGIDAILRENYVSVQAMFRLNDAVERIDSSFQFALAGREGEALRQFDHHWKAFDEQFAIEAANVTIHPAEDDLVEKLRLAKTVYRDLGHRFYALPAESSQRSALYFGKPGEPGLLGYFGQIKTTSNEILRINQQNMEQARDRARDAARTALLAFAASLAGVSFLLVGIGWYLLRTILRPIRAVTDAARAISHSGELNRDVPVHGRDELGQLADAFNAMTRELRRYRRSNLDRMLRAQRTAQATIDSFSDPILVVDPNGRPDLANPAARGLFGVGPSPEGESAPVWQPPESLRQPLANALQTQRAYQTEQFDQAISFRFDGEDRTYLPHVRPISDSDGNTLGAAVVLNDVTRFRLLDQFKSDLVATVSHELKTPLTSVRLAVHVLLEETIGPLNAKQTELLMDARDNAERLLTQIEQLLALARLQRPGEGEERTPENPADLLRRATDAIHGRAEDKHVEIVVVDDDEPLPMVAVNAERIALALGNLLDNAVTYTPAGGRITLSAKAADGSVELAVADTGIGIPHEYLPRVFERFFRVPGQSSPAGTGLGLAIVKEIVAAQGGQVSCDSEPGQGATFRIRLPAEATHGP